MRTDLKVEFFALKSHADVGNSHRR